MMTVDEMNVLAEALKPHIENGAAAGAKAAMQEHLDYVHVPLDAKIVAIGKCVDGVKNRVNSIWVKVFGISAGCAAIGFFIANKLSGH